MFLSLLLIRALLACAADPPAAPTAPIAAPAEPVAAPAPTPAEPPHAPIHADLHLDTPTQLYRKDVPLDHPTALEGGLPQLLAAHTNLAVEVLWPPKPEGGNSHANMLLDRLLAEIDRLELVELARSPAEARRIADAGHIAVVVSMEGAHGLGEDWRADLSRLRARGLSLLGLTWSFSNRFGGSSGDQGGGLSEDGRALVSLARSEGILLDVSHASRATTLELCRDSAMPLIASHSDAAAVTPAARNLTDEEILCVAKTGGVIGLNLHSAFVGGGADVRAIADHADHIAQVGGYGAVALGSDFDGLIRVPKDITDASKLELLWAELARRGWTADQIAGARGENFMRAWEGAVAAAKR